MQLYSGRIRSLVFDFESLEATQNEKKNTFKTQNKQTKKTDRFEDFEDKSRFAIIKNHQKQQK